jgi:hypothetical protein
MAGVSLIVRDKATGREKLNTSSRNVLFFGSRTIGGVGAAQDGSLTDARFSYGTLVVFVLESAFTGTNGLEPIFTQNGNTLSWHYPSSSNQYASDRPAAVFLYGVSAL